MLTQLLASPPTPTTIVMPQQRPRALTTLAFSLLHLHTHTIHTQNTGTKKALHKRNDWATSAGDDGPSGHAAPGKKVKRKGGREGGREGGRRLAYYVVTCTMAPHNLNTQTHTRIHRHRTPSASSMVGKATTARTSSKPKRKSPPLLPFLPPSLPPSHPSLPPFVFPFILDG